MTGELFPSAPVLLYGQTPRHDRPADSALTEPPTYAHGVLREEPVTG